MCSRVDDAATRGLRAPQATAGHRIWEGQGTPWLVCAVCTCVPADRVQRPLGARARARPCQRHAKTPSVCADCRAGLRAHWRCRRRLVRAAAGRARANKPSATGNNTRRCCVVPHCPWGAHTAAASCGCCCCCARTNSLTEPCQRRPRGASRRPAAERRTSRSGSRPT